MGMESQPQPEDQGTEGHLASYLHCNRIRKVIEIDWESFRMIL